MTRWDPLWSTRAGRCAGALLGLAAALVLTSGPAAAMAIVLVESAGADRIERQRAYANGELPLPGTPALSKLAERRAALGFASGAPAFIRIFKASSELEVFLRKNGRFELFASYPICMWDGGLGPKLLEGDRQSPEGFYAITPERLRWYGRWHRGLDIGYPNAFDRANGRTGSGILIHGACSSIGCFAITNPVIEDVFELAVDALDGGQRQIPVHVFPFRMTDANLSLHADNMWSPFWRGLKRAHDLFDRDRMAPRVSVCAARYVAEAGEPGATGGDGVVERCPIAAATGPREINAIADAALAPKASNRLATRLAAVRKAGLGANRYPAYVAATTAGGLPCNIGLASCRKWVALRRGVTLDATALRTGKRGKAAGKTRKKRLKLARR